MSLSSACNLIFVSVVWSNFPTCSLSRARLRQVHHPRKHFTWPYYCFNLGLALFFLRAGTSCRSRNVVDTTNRSFSAVSHCYCQHPIYQGSRHRCFSPFCNSLSCILTFDFASLNLIDSHHNQFQSPLTSCFRGSICYCYYFIWCIPLTLHANSSPWTS